MSPSTAKAGGPKTEVIWIVRSGIGESIRGASRDSGRRRAERLDAEVAAARAPRRAIPEAVATGVSRLANADGPALEAVAALADSLRRDVVGDDVTFVVNRNINFTNICYTGCRFCAFAQRKGDADAFSLSTTEVADRAWGGACGRSHRGVHAGAASIPNCR